MILQWDFSQSSREANFCIVSRPNLKTEMADPSFWVLTRRKSHSTKLMKIIEILKKFVTCIPIARQQPGKHIPARAKAPKNRTSIARQRISKHAFLTIEEVFSAWSVQSGYKEVFAVYSQVEKNGVEFEMSACRHMSLELNWVGGYRILARMELGWEKILHVRCDMRVRLW
jgi:hypothetical protein